MMPSAHRSFQQRGADQRFPIGDRECYDRLPLAVRDDIPVFSTEDDYTRNYERISRDHLDAARKTGVSNPFIPDDVWHEMEQSTIGLVNQYGREKDRVLDLGVRLARVLSHFPGLRRHGMDISFAYLKEARGKEIDVCFSRIEDMPYKEGWFDLIVCTDVFEHVLDLHACCVRILHVLKPGGILIVRVPYREDRSYYASPECPYDYVHLRAIDEHSLRMRFEKVFECTVVEMQARPYSHCGRVKYTFPVPKSDTLVKVIARLLKRCSTALYGLYCRGLFHPLEINVVIRKKRGPLCAASQAP
jgi:SAM-dependent methyltransferase